MFRAALVVSLLGAWAPSAGAHPASERVGFRWPEPLSLHFSAAHGVMEWSDVSFADPFSALQMPGDALHMERLDLWGAQLGIGYSSEWVRLEGGIAYYAPAGGLANLELPSLGPHARIGRAHLMRWFLEAGVGHRFGDLSLFVVVQAGLVRALVDTEEPRLMLRGRRLSLGPKLGLRAHVFETVFVQAAFFASVVEAPDHTLTLGVGLGRR